MKKRILSFGKRFIGHELVAGSIYVFMGFFIGSIFGFLVNLFLARNLTSSDYGIYASLLSLFTLASIPTQSVVPIVVRFAADFFAKGEIDKGAGLYFKVFKFLLFLSLFILVIFLLLSSSIGSFLHIDNFWYIFLIGISVSISYLSVINTAFLQSLLKFSFVGISYALNGIARISVAVILVYLGFKVFGAIVAILFALLISFLFQFIPLKFLFSQRKAKAEISGKEIVEYALPTAITTLSLMSLTSMDVILVKHFFSPESAGLYGGLSLVGKVIFYFTGPIPLVMFPLLIKRYNLGQNFNNLFYLSLLLVAIPSVVLTLIYFVLPQFTINLFLGGGSYLKVTNYLGLFGIFLTLFSLINVFVNFFLSLKKTGIFIFVFIAALAQIFLITLFHSSFFQVILDSLSVSFVLLAILSILYLFELKNRVSVKEELPITTPIS